MNTTASFSINRSRLVERFLRYVAIDTSADPNADCYPSSKSQTKLAELVADELRQCGVADVSIDQHSLVWAMLPGNGEMATKSPALLLNSHLDTSPEAPAANIRPRIVENFDGQPISLTAGISIDSSNTPELADLVGKTLIVTDGTTLLGGDDKAGVAVIVEFAATLLEQQIEHRPIQILFTCDEEIGEGTKHVSTSKCQATYGYTLDGSGQGIIEAENFSADCATIRFKGVNIHPAIAKGRMVNALRAAASFVTRLSIDHQSPESTDGRMGFMHPYRLDGNVGSSTLMVLLRDFDTPKLQEYRHQLESIAVEVMAEFPGLEIVCEFRQQYRNMAERIQRCPEVVSDAIAAYRAIGLEPKQELIRGGTDGAVMTEKGIPMPNLATGQHNIHSVREFVCVEEMENAIRHLFTLCTTTRT